MITPPKIEYNFELYRPQLLAELKEPKNAEDILYNWISTQGLLEEWQSYAMDFLEKALVKE